MSHPDIAVSYGNNFKFVNDNSIDLVLTDPPFNISRETNFHTYEKNTIHSYEFDKQNEEKWDTYSQEEFLIKLDEWSSEWSRVLRKGGNFAIFCADAYISHLMNALKKNNLSPRRLITWRKNNPVPINRAYMPMSANEYIIVGVKKGKSTFNADVPIINQTIDQKIIEANIVSDKVSTLIHSKVSAALLNMTLKKNDEDHVENVIEEIKTVLNNSVKAIEDKVSSMYKTNKDGDRYLQACVPNYVQNPLKTGHRIHPTEKPVSLLKYLIALYSNSGDLILDSFAGSGATAEAAFELSRRTILVEQDEKFFNNILKRFNDKNYGILAPDIEIVE